MIQIRNEFNYLKQARCLVAKDMQLNNFSRINNFFHETGLHSRFIYRWIEKEYRESVDTKISPQAKFSIIHKEFIEHLDRRISKIGVYLLLNEVKVERSAFSKIMEIKDLWMEGIQKNSPVAELLLHASMHIQDILFGCKIALEQAPELTQSFLQDEFAPFVRDFLPGYLELLSRKEPLARSEIQQGFEALENAMSLNQPGLANEKLSTIQALVNPFK